MEHDSVEYDASYSESYYYDIPPKTKQALEDYATAMAYCKQENMSILNDIDAYVLRPIDQYQMISKTIDKTITKRQHKLMDFDRHRISYMKFSSIGEPTPSEEKHIIKLQAQFDNAAREYEYFNTMLKEELAYFLDMTLDFIEPVFQVFYDAQCRITGGIYSRLDEVIQHNSANFPTLDLPVGEGYTKRLEERNAGEELDNTDLFKKGLKPWERRGKKKRMIRIFFFIQAYHRLRRSTISSISKPSSPFSDNQQDEEKNISPSVVKKKRTPPPPPPSKRTPAGNINKDEKKEYAEALYNLDAPQDGDLSFRVGDKIEILEKTEKSHDWWKGQIGDRVGMFPGKL
ncbi:MAG: hypothetical protein EXX96DRAFT_485298 [Benjaminiella poitrasii]|nr:MAG: hypothetical protein EXX96DRAFT_485298 [Benjaminiella poitrasii]